MSGHIRQRGKGGQWYAVIDVIDPATGKRKRRWHRLERCNGKKEAQKAAARLILQREDGIYIDPNKATAAQWLERWLERVKPNVAPRTYERYADIVRSNIVPLIGAVKLCKLEPEHISAAYTTALRKGTTGKGPLSPQTVMHMHRVLKQSLKLAVRWQKVVRNVADSVDAPKIEKHPMQVYDVKQTMALLDAIKGRRMFIPALLAAMCGLRRGEVAALRWRNVDLTKASLSVDQSAEQTRARVRYKEPKRGRGRCIALSGTVVRELRAWKVTQAQEMLRLGVRVTDDSLICTTAAGEGIQPNSLSHEFQKVIKRAGLRRIRFHDLRHSHATHMLASGVHAKVASERLGHANVGITLDLYSHVLPGMQEDAVAKLDIAFQEAMRRT